MTDLKVTYLSDSGIFVVRDDLLRGGSKSRAAKQYLLQLKAKGIQDVMYASPAYGYAQIALADAIKDLPMSLGLYAVNDADGWASKYTRYAAELCGAQDDIIGRANRFRVENSLEDAELAIDNNCRDDWNPSEVFVIPLGLDCPEFIDLLAEDLKAGLQKWSDTVKESPMPPEQLPDHMTHVAALGSGTFAKALRKALPEHTKLILLDVNVITDKSDPRLCAVRDLPNTAVVQWNGKFEDQGVFTPSFSSNPYYDAKAYEYVSLRYDKASPIVWWNIAGDVPE